MRVHVRERCLVDGCQWTGPSYDLNCRCARKYQRQLLDHLASAHEGEQDQWENALPNREIVRIDFVSGSRSSRTYRPPASST